MEFKLEIWASGLWIFACVLILISVLGSMFLPLYLNIWNLFHTISYGALALGLFLFSIGLSKKNKDISQLAIAAAVCYIILFAVLLFTDPTILFANQSFIIKTIALVAVFSAALFLVYFGFWIFNSRYAWKIEQPALFAFVLNLISAFFLFFEKVSSITFYKLEVSYLILIIAMAANIFLLKKIKID